VRKLRLDSVEYMTLTQDYLSDTVCPKLVIRGRSVPLGSPFRPLRVGWHVVVGAISEFSVAVPEKKNFLSFICS